MLSLRVEKTETAPRSSIRSDVSPRLPQDVSDIFTAYLLNWTYAGQHGFCRRSDGWSGLSADVSGVSGVVSRRRFVCGVFGPFALARRFSVPVVRPRSGVANLAPALEVCELRAQDLGDRRNDLSSHPKPVEHMVRCNLADHLTEERRVGQESARHARFGLL